jgi:uncharacterized protein
VTTAGRVPDVPRHVDLDGLRREVSRRLADELPPELSYHDAWHTLEDVVPAALALATDAGVSAREHERIHAAALLHDLGFTRTMIEHEQAGVGLARELLPSYGFDPADVAAVERLILATRLGHEPACVSEAIMSDADLDVLGRSDFWRRHRALQRELAACGQRHGDFEWSRMQLRFLRTHRYHTEQARARGDAGKVENERRVLQRLRRLATLTTHGRIVGR